MGDLAPQPADHKENSLDVNKVVNQVAIPRSSDSGIWEEKDYILQTSDKLRTVSNFAVDPLIECTLVDKNDHHSSINSTNIPISKTSSTERNPVQKSYNEEPPRIANYMCRLPMMGNHSIDQTTLGHFALSDALTMYYPLTIFGNANLKQNALHPWKYDGLEKDIYLFSMEPVHNCYSVAGMGIFKHNPSFIYDILRNPSSRFLYDRLLSKFQILEKVDDFTQVVQMRLAFQRCFFKEERDVLAVCSHREVKPNFFVCAGKSTEHRLYKEDKRIQKVLIHLCAFIIEPFVIGPHSEITDWSSLSPPTACKVTYILKVELNKLPSSVIKYILKRQPLCLAYLNEKISWKTSP